MLEFIATCFGKHLVKGAKLTEAAIRQSLGNSSKAIMIDEFEADNNRRKTMELVRVAGGGGEIHRGTASGKVRSFGLAHIFWFAAIELGLNDEADKNRFIEIVLERPPQRASRLDLPPIAEMEEIRTWIMATAIYYGKKCREIVADLKFHSIPGVDIRMVEQYAVPAAFISVLANEFDDKNPKYSPEFFLEQFVLPRTEMIRAVADEKSLIDEILGSVVRTGGGDEKKPSDRSCPFITMMSAVPMDKILRHRVLVLRRWKRSESKCL